jgi:hypothetical protein
MPALLINIKIDEEEKFNLFKVTLNDLSGLFSECHIKFRGAYSHKCLEVAKILLDKSKSLKFYQDLQEDDWVDATLSMLGNVKSRSLFLYFEDHKLVSTRSHLESVLIDFDKQNLDYLCYSWFQASALGIENLLPLNPEKGTMLHVIKYSKTEKALIGKISPGYYTFSLVNICSVEYLKSIITSCNMRFKFYNKTITALLSRLYPYPGYRRVAHVVNSLVNKFGIYLCLYPPASPFNLEKIWFEMECFFHRPWRFGILVMELFANFDDDNGPYKESLVKRGLYPFQTRVEQSLDLKQMPQINFRVHLKDGELYDCTYFSHRGRINNPPVVHILVEAGKVIVTCQSLETTLENSSGMYFYTNKSPVVRSLGNSIITLGVFDECF